MSNTTELLTRLQKRQVPVDLTSPNGTPLKAITVVGRCHSALRRACIPNDELQAFMDLTTEPARAAAALGADYQVVGAEIMNEPGYRVLALAKSHLRVRSNR